MAFENRYASAKHPQMGHYRPIYRQSADDGFGVVAVFAAFVGFGTMRDVFSWYARLGRSEHSGLFYELFQRRGWQRKCGFRRIPIPYRRIGRHGNDLAAQWFRLGDDRYDVELDRVRYRAVVDLLASGLGGKR